MVVAGTRCRVPRRCCIDVHQLACNLERSPNSFRLYSPRMYSPPRSAICDVAKSAYVSLRAGRAAYAEASLRCYLCMAAGCLISVTVPGLFYTRDPPLLGGPLGRLLRWPARRAARGPQRRHSVNFYQGVGFILLGIALAVDTFAGYVSDIFVNAPIGSAADAAAIWLIFLSGILPLVAIIVIVPLSLGGTTVRWRRI